MAQKNVRLLTSTPLRRVHVSPLSPVSLRACIHTHFTHTNVRICVQVCVRRPNSDALM